MRSQRGGIRADDGGKSASSTRSSVSTVPTLNNSWSSSHYRRMEGKTRKGDSNSSDSACANEAILRELERLQADATETNEDPTDPLDWPMATVMLIPPKQEKSKIRRNRRFSVCSSETAYPSERFSAHNVHVDAWEFARQNQLVEKLDRSMTLMIPKQASETAFDGPTKSSTTTELRRFYCPNIETAELSLRALPTGEFRLFPRDSTVRFSMLSKRTQNASFAIYYKKSRQKISCFRILEASAGSRSFFFVECIDDAVPKFETLRELLNFYVNSFPYYSFADGDFVHFPCGKVMRKYLFSYHFGSD